MRRREVSLILCGNLLKTVHRLTSIFSAYIAASVVYIVKTLRNEPISPGEAFALITALSVIYLNSIMTLGQSVLSANELRATFKKITQILCLP